MIKSVLSSIRFSVYRPLCVRAFSTTQTTDSDVKYEHNVKFGKSLIDEKVQLAQKFKNEVEELKKRWKEKYDIYFGKERDLVNYPHPAQPLYHPKVRMGFLPDEWFQALYHKTGVTGPYLFMWGGILFLLQKEIWVMDHQFYEVPGFAIAVTILVKYLGPYMSKYTGKLADKRAYAIAELPKERFRRMINYYTENATKSLEKKDLSLELFQGCKENVGLQLEAIYRERANAIHRAVKSRLDYQVEKETSKQKFHRDHMISWIVNSVVKDFGPQQEKATIAQCLADLKVLAQQQVGQASV